MHRVYDNRNSRHPCSQAAKYACLAAMGLDDVGSFAPKQSAQRKQRYHIPMRPDLTHERVHQAKVQSEPPNACVHGAFRAGLRSRYKCDSIAQRPEAGHQPNGSLLCAANGQLRDYVDNPQNLRRPLGHQRPLPRNTLLMVRPMIRASSIRL
jgi:anaerobic selenocysteine-containing dehydrogenase